MFWAALGGFLFSIIGRLLIALGIGFVSFTGLSSILDYVLLEVKSNVNGLGPTMVNLMGLMKIDLGINMIFSAYVINLTMTSMRRFVG